MTRFELTWEADWRFTCAEHVKWHGREGTLKVNAVSEQGAAIKIRSQACVLIDAPLTLRNCIQVGEVKPVIENNRSRTYGA